MNETFEFTLNNPLSEEQWDMIADVDMERTDSITFHTKHGKEVEFAKVRHGRWVGAESKCGIGCPFCGTPVDDFCSSIDYINLIYEPNYCPNCGAKMDGAERKEE